MANTNIGRFDEISADILAFLYERFPIPEYISPAVAGLSVIVYGDYDPVSGLHKNMSGEIDPETELFNSTLAWLVHAGFIHEKGSQHFSSRYFLTPQGLQALKHVPKPALGAETLGEKLSVATKAGAKSAASELLNQALSIGVQLITKQAGF
ncbi:hypothetical protein [Pseudomonas syringae]|uniref:hypothetical protein n=1 Tax=Pseudomonas syringae TaxID=317 RepID=UPI0011C3ACF4|nr:hypothetical protein [Pseudomonas syringae]